MGCHLLQSAIPICSPVLVSWQQQLDGIPAGCALLASFSPPHSSPFSRLPVNSISLTFTFFLSFSPLRPSLSQGSRFTS